MAPAPRMGRFGDTAAPSPADRYRVALPNDNRTAAGTLQNGMRTISGRQGMASHQWPVESHGLQFRPTEG
jgi:hypothetical protein